jgi:hypothetical protein
MGSDYTLHEACGFVPRRVYTDVYPDRLRSACAVSRCTLLLSPADSLRIAIAVALGFPELSGFFFGITILVHRSSKFLQESSQDPFS